MNNFYVFYRYSDAGNPLGRTDLKGTALEIITKEKIRENFFSVFDPKSVIVIADNAEAKSMKYFKEKKVKDIHATNLGNLRGWRYLFTYITQQSNFDDNDIIYVCEDDYLHFSNSEELLREGLNISDYCSLYDHLDKYKNANNGGNNPLITGGGEFTKVVITESTHWKWTNSTTGTFASKVSTLKKDYNIFMKYSQEGLPHPLDFLMFRELITQRNRTIATCIPGRSSHVGLEMSPFVDFLSLIK